MWDLRIKVLCASRNVKNLQEVCEGGILILLRHARDVTRGCSFTGIPRLWKESKLDKAYETDAVALFIEIMPHHTHASGVGTERSSVYAPSMARS